MIIAVGQPYFCPYPGFFHRIRCSDLFVLLDTVQFPRGFTWITRNRFKNDQGTLWLSVPIHRKGLGLQTIDAVRIHHDGKWHRKHLASLRHAYRHAPYFNAHAPFLDGVFASGAEHLLEVNLPVITYLCRQLAIGTEVRRLSEFGIHANGTALLIELCRRTGADTFLAPRPARRYIDATAMAQAGVAVSFVTSPALVYPQLWGDFIGNLSTFDLLFNCGPKAGELIAGESATHQL